MHTSFVCDKIVRICLKPFYKVIAVNSEKASSHPIPVYDGDSAEKVADRIRRVAGLIGT